MRLGTGLILLLSVLLAGAWARSAWLILPLTLIYTLAFILGRWQAWRHSIATDTISRVLSQLLATGLTQAVLVALLYLIGRGVGAMFGRAHAAPLEMFDLLYCATVALLGLGLGAFVVWREPLARLPNRDTQPVSRDEIELLPELVTPQNFFHGIHYGHGSYTGPEKSFADRPNELSAGSDAKISAAEVRLNVCLPDGLKALYRVQNGGSVSELCTLKSGVSQPRLFDDLILPFTGYDDLLPSESLRTLLEAVTEFSAGNADSDVDLLPAGSAQLVILAQYYRYTLFLDYRSSTEPRVGFVDFDDFSNWQPHCVWWENFDAFFSALRRFRAMN